MFFPFTNIISYSEKKIVFSIFSICASPKSQTFILNGTLSGWNLKIALIAI